MATKDSKRGRGNSSSTGGVVELKHTEQRARGADALLNNKLLTKALNDMKDSALQHISASEPHETEKRETLYQFAKAIDCLYKQLDVYVNKGKNASHRLEEILHVGKRSA